MHQLAEDPLEVGEGILAVTPDLLDEGVNHRTAPAGLVVADEHPVLHAELGRADGVFGEVVLESAGHHMRDYKNIIINAKKSIEIARIRKILLILFQPATKGASARIITNISLNSIARIIYCIHHIYSTHRSRHH
jgi:hypothetical protein